VGDILIEVSDGLDVGVGGGCESCGDYLRVWSPSAKCGCGCRLLPAKALLGVLLVVAGLRLPLHCFARGVARGTGLILRGGYPKGECRGRSP